MSKPIYNYYNSSNNGLSSSTNATINTYTTTANKDYLTYTNALNWNALDALTVTSDGFSTLGINKRVIPNPNEYLTSIGNIINYNIPDDWNNLYESIRYRNDYLLKNKTLVSKKEFSENTAIFVAANYQFTVDDIKIYDIVVDRQIVLLCNKFTKNEITAILNDSFFVENDKLCLIPQPNFSEEHLETILNGKDDVSRKLIYNLYFGTRTEIDPDFLNKHADMLSLERIHDKTEIFNSNVITAYKKLREPSDALIDFMSKSYITDNMSTAQMTDFYVPDDSMLLDGENAILSKNIPISVLSYMDYQLTDRIYSDPRFLDIFTENNYIFETFTMTIAKKLSKNDLPKFIEGLKDYLEANPEKEIRVDIFRIINKINKSKTDALSKKYEMNADDLLFLYSRCSDFIKKSESLMKVIKSSDAYDVIKLILEVE